MNPNRLSGHISIFGLVVFVLKPLLGMETMVKFCNFAAEPSETYGTFDNVGYCPWLFFTRSNLSLCSHYTGLKNHNR